MVGVEAGVEVFGEYSLGFLIDIWVVDDRKKSTPGGSRLAFYAMEWFSSP